MQKSIIALYSLNKQAKKYRKQPTQKSQNRSQALYTLKHNYLLKIKHKMDKIETHYIDNKKYYCFYYQQFSFHIPENKIKTEKIKTKNTKILHNFKTDSIPDKQTYSEKQALNILFEKYNLNANSYLPANCSLNAYWSHLPKNQISC